MTDLVTRLRALAVSLYKTRQGQAGISEAVGEAADALEWQESIMKALQQRCDKQAPDQLELQQELDTLNKRVVKLEAALQHYAKEETYKGMTKTSGQWELLTREAKVALENKP